MAKKKRSNNTVSLVRKAAAVLASVVTFIFFFLEMITYKIVVKNVFTGEKETLSNEGVKVSDFLFNSDYESFREVYGTVNTILWIVFVLVIAAIVISALAFVMKKGAIFSKIGACLLVLGMLLMFIVNFDKPENITSYFTNITALYFVALVLSIAATASVITLKD